MENHDKATFEFWQQCFLKASDLYNSYLQGTQPRRLPTVYDRDCEPIDPTLHHFEWCTGYADACIQELTSRLR